METKAQSELAQLTETLQGVRDHFEQGGSVSVLLLVLAGLAAAVCLAVCLTRRQRQGDGNVETADSNRLFSDLLDKLDLTAEQRHMLGTAVTDLGLGQPAVILLSPVLFDSHLDRWLGRESGAGNADRASRERVLREARKVLFPSRDVDVPEAPRGIEQDGSSPVIGVTKWA
jgi:hypothetical protein